MHSYLFLSILFREIQKLINNYYTLFLYILFLNVCRFLLIFSYCKTNNNYSNLIICYNLKIFLIVRNGAGISLLPFFINFHSLHKISRFNTELNKCPSSHVSDRIKTYIQFDIKIKMKNENYNNKCHNIAHKTVE